MDSIGQVKYGQGREGIHSRFRQNWQSRHRKLISTESQFYFANISATKARIFLKFYVEVNYYLVSLSTDHHEMWNLSSQDSNWPPQKISWRSELSLRRFLQNNSGVFFYFYLFIYFLIYNVPHQSSKISARRKNITGCSSNDNNSSSCFVLMPQCIKKSKEDYVQMQRWLNISNNQTLWFFCF